MGKNSYTDVVSASHVRKCPLLTGLLPRISGSTVTSRLLLVPVDELDLCRVLRVSPSPFLSLLLVADALPGLLMFDLLPRWSTHSLWCAPVDPIPVVDSFAARCPRRVPAV